MPENNRDKDSNRNRTPAGAGQGASSNPNMPGRTSEEPAQRRDEGRPAENRPANKDNKPGAARNR